MLQLATDKIVQIICQKIPAVQAIYLFGSTNTVFATAASDVDLAILPAAKLNVVQVWQVAQELASVINKDIDLIDLWQASTIMRWQVINSGKCIYCRDPVVAAEFETMALSSYIRFNDERGEIMEEIQQRGQVL